MRARLALRLCLLVSLAPFGLCAHRAEAQGIADKPTASNAASNAPSAAAENDDHATSHPASDQVQWARATDLLASGQQESAVSLLLDLANRWPGSPLADDALYLAGTVQEEKLNDPKAALESYSRLVEMFPDSRVALSTTRRMVAIEQAIGSDGAGAQALARFTALLNGFAEREEEESLRLALAILRDYPNWGQRYEVQLWIAAALRRQGDIGAALPYYEQVASSEAPSEGRRLAALGAAEINILLGRYQQAELQLGTLRALSANPSDMHALEEVTALLDKTRSRERLLLVSKIVLMLMILALLLLLRRATGSKAETWKALRRPPLEVYYMLPFVVLLTAMALTGHQEIGPAVASISVGGLFITWLCGALLRAQKPLSLGFALLSAGLATIAVASLVYLTVFRSSLLDLIVSTVRFGPE